MYEISIIYRHDYPFFFIVKKKVRSGRPLVMTELACVYAALILNDDGIDISADKLNKLLDAAGVKIESYWVDLFAEYFKTQNIEDLLKGTCLGGAAPAAGAAAGGEAAAEEKKEEKKEEEEVVELAGGFDDLFG